MKKIYLSIIVSIMSINLSAQITLTSLTSSPQVGNSFNYVVTPDFTFNVNQSGANQTWDFSSATGTSSTVNYINLSSSSDSSTYHSANIVEVSLDAENYYSSSTSELTMEGSFSTGVLKIIYDDKRELIKFPITYNDVFSETFSGTVEVIAEGRTFNRSGAIKIMADAYGDLILPYTTVNNVLRVKAIYNYSDSFMGTKVFSYTDTICTWYNATTNNFIANTSVTYTNGTLLTSLATHIEQRDLVTEINDSRLTDNQISFYPNPANDYIIVENVTNEMLSVSIYDIRGVLIKTVNIQNEKKKVNVSDLNSGIYLLKYADKTYSYIEKLVVE